MFGFPDSFEMPGNFDNNDSFFFKPLNELNLYEHEQDIFFPKDKDNDIYNENNICSYNLKDERTTLEKTKKKTNTIDNNLICWTLDTIQNNIFDKEIYKSRFTSVKSKLINDVQIDEPFLNKKRNREFTVNNDTYDSKDNNNNNEFEIETIKKRGRKPKKEIGERKHNRKSGDNIIKKVKSKL